MCASLHDAGLGCGVLMAPILPYLSDSPSTLRAAVAEIAAAGATSVTPLVLHLRPGAREWYLDWLGRHHPALVPRYLALYGRGSYAPAWYQERITGIVRDAARSLGIGRHAPGGADGPAGPLGTGAADGPRGATGPPSMVSNPPAPDGQLSLL